MKTRVKPGPRAPCALACAVSACLACLDPAPLPPLPEAPPPQAGRQPVVTGTTSVVQYTLRFSRRSSHYMDVEAVYPTRGRSELEVMMPVWTPGSYLVREHARHVEAVRAATPDGEPRAVEKVAKNRLRLLGEGHAHVVLRYRVYGREATVRTNFIDADFAVLAPAAVFFGDVDHLDKPHQLFVELPSEWTDVAVALPRVEGTETATHGFVAADFDVLVDSPLLLGRLDRRTFTAGGVPHEVVTFGGGDVWDYARAARDAKTIAETTIRFWGGIVPYDRYLFLNVLNEEGGGLEHRASTVLMSSKWVARDEASYRRWTGLVAHELFHAWNGKRLRPRALGPFDYDRENYTRGLWVAEGFTSYYDNLLRVRAGLLTFAAFLDILSDDIEVVTAGPGQGVQSLDEASYDAWIKFYRADENWRNTGVSYYKKGALLAWLLDARIRRATGDRRSLDDVMRVAYRRFAGRQGYTRDELIKTVAEVGGADVGRWLDRAARTAAPLDYRPALRWFGLRFQPVPKPPRGAGPTARDARRKTTWLGLTTEQAGGRVMVARVQRGSPAERAGINVDDELIGLGGARITDLEKSLGRYEPGTRLQMLVARRGSLRTLEVTLGKRPRESWRLEVAPKKRATARRHRRAWLRATLK